MDLLREQLFSEWYFSPHRIYKLYMWGVVVGTVVPGLPQDETKQPKGVRRELGPSACTIE